MAKLVSGLEEFPLLDVKLSNKEMYIRGCTLLIESGFPKYEIQELDYDDPINVYAEEEMLLGRARIKSTITLILESGDKIESKPVYRYIDESYEDSLARELDESDIVYDSGNILEFALETSESLNSRVVGKENTMVVLEGFDDEDEEDELDILNSSINS